MTPPLLAIECSQRAGGIALLDGNGASHRMLFDPEARHDDVLVPAIDSMLRDHGCARDDLAGCGVSIGPGGFTGLRVSIATVKSLALALELPVYGVPSALVVASSVPDPPSEMVIALAGKGDTAWFTSVVKEDGRWRIRGEASLVRSDGNQDEFDSITTIVADEHLPESFRRAADDRGMTILPPRWDPMACLSLTRHRHESGDADEPHSLQPIYPRVPEAVSIWEAKKRP